MPSISFFYGIIIYMYFYDNREHHSPHLHAVYQDDKAVLSIPDGELLSGNLPKNKLRVVQAWIELRKEDLLADWNLAVNGQELYPIEPLK
ncbi:MAG: hypothetical protein A2X64_10825 [Ignavibacteria bacterium GWF2_33_9]|nr:MAG: hypothetical protein A2X64_10825 [Ignavibacteria bacterium GWF2_33_9]